VTDAVSPRGPVLIRREQPGDREAALALHTAAFASYPGNGALETRLVVELDADGDVDPRLSLVAVDGEQVVGHVVCSRGELAGEPVLGLGPIGVLPERQGQGIGAALMHAVLGAAEALDEPGVALLGNPAFYRRFGFVTSTSLGVEPPEAAWGPHFQVRPLSAWHDGLRGRYRYAAAFSRL